MVISCSVPRHLATSTLPDKLRQMGITPHVDTESISVFYNGPDLELGGALVELFAHEANHRIQVH